MRKKQLPQKDFILGVGGVPDGDGVGAGLGTMAGVIGDHMVITPHIQDIGNNVLAVSGVHKLRAVIALLVNK